MPCHGVCYYCFRFFRSISEAIARRKRINAQRAVYFDRFSPSNPQYSITKEVNGDSRQVVVAIIVLLAHGSSHHYYPIFCVVKTLHDNPVQELLAVAVKINSNQCSQEVPCALEKDLEKQGEIIMFIRTTTICHAVLHSTSQPVHLQQ